MMTQPVVEEPMQLGSQSPVRLVRQPYLVPRVVIIGGQTGCGKSLFPPMIGSMRNVELPAYNYTIEYLCALHFLGKMADDATTTMIRMLTDLDLYHLVMSRGVNFRLTDFTSVFRNTGTWRYIRRLFQPGDEAAVERIQQDKPILQLTIHNALSFGQPLFDALGDRLRVLEVVRHPLYMVKQGFLYYQMYGTDPREFSIWIDYQGQALPYFAKGWEDRYVRSCLMDRVIYSMERLTMLAQEVLERLTAPQRAQVMVVPFERFVLDPWPYLKQLEQVIGASVTSDTPAHLRRQRVPRRHIADGTPLPVYKRFGWEPAQQGLSERDERHRRRQYAAREATPEALDVLDRLSEAYEATYWPAGCR